MKEENGRKIVELKDVLEAKILGSDVTIDDWPYGRSKRCQMHFWVEIHKSNKKERLMKQSTFNGRINKPKKDVYCKRCLILEIDEMLCHVHFNQYGTVRVSFENGKYATVYFHDTDFAAVLWNELINSN